MRTSTFLMVGPRKTFILGCLLCVGSSMVLGGQTWADADGAEKEASAKAHGFSAVKEIVGQEKGLDKILVIKHPRKGIQSLLKKIAEVSQKADQDLESWSKQNPDLIAKDNGFPPIEKKARGGMQSDMAKSFLLTGGKNFEIRMLVGQIQATDYLSHAFDALADVEKNDEIKTQLKKYKESFEKLTSEGFVLLGAKK